MVQFTTLHSHLQVNVGSVDFSVVLNRKLETCSEVSFEFTLVLGRYGYEVFPRSQAYLIYFERVLLF